MSARGRDAVGRADPLALTATCVALGAMVTVAAVASSPDRFAYRSVSAHVALETADAMMAAIVAYLAYGRARRTATARDMLLAASIGLLAVADFVFAGAATADPLGVPAPALARTVLGVRLLATATLAAAGLVRPAISAGRVRVPLLGLGVVLVGLGLTMTLTAGALPLALDPASAPSTVTGSGATAVVRVLQLAEAVLLGVAGAAFTARARRTGDRVEAWVGAAAVLGAVARLDYAIVPSMLTEWISVGDVLRTVFYLLLLASAVAEITRYWAAQAELAVFEERRRVARDLHDGAVQEIGYARTIATRLARLGVDPDAGHLVTATERALDEMRAALTALSAPLDEPLADTIGRAAGEVADRYDVPLTMRVEGSFDVTHPEREALIRIAREAVANAVRHGRPQRVTVELSRRPRQLVVRDDGLGFSSPAERPSGYGIASMRDRAAAIGGTFDIDSRPGRGTTVRVSW